MRTARYLIYMLLLGTAARGAAMTIEQKAQSMLDVWSSRLDERGLRYVVAAPFVIAGDGTARQLADYRDHTVMAATRALKAMYFKKDLEEPVLILLFESEAPYRKVSAKWFDQNDPPHFGYYRRRDRVMVMNVATGTGTLVHELTHALIAPDFPNVPDWFNEGLASLYEQCTIDSDSIQGAVNWRLPALQRAIRDGKLRSLGQLIQDSDFYRNDLVGLNYAQARYLLFYLQERHLLRSYYHDFRDHVADDPTGLKALEKLIAPRPLGQFEDEWKQWVLRL